MPEERRNLDQIQRWMQSVIMHPGGIEEGVQSDAARQHIAVRPDGLEEVITRSRALPAADRLAIYQRAYFARLLECLREEFPVFSKAVTPDVFDEFAVDYLLKYPSRSYTLNRLGTNFPRYLAETRPEAESTEGWQLGWPDFLIDLARLELAFNEVFDGPGVENEPPLSAEHLRSVPPQRWPEARLRPVKCLRLMRLHYPVHDYYDALRKGADPSPPAPQETLLAITRRDFVVRRYPLSRPQHELLKALMESRSISQAVGAAVTTGTNVEDLAGELENWFRHWAAEGFFQSIVVPD